MKKILHELLSELEEQLSIIEPHSDVVADCKAHENALSLIHLLKFWAQNPRNIYNIKYAYFKSKIEITSNDFEGPQ